MQVVQQRIERIRGDRPWLDRAARAAEHYVAVSGSKQAASITYFAFLSFFPLLALAFVAIGLVSAWFPHAQDTLTEALTDLAPGLFGEGSGAWSLETIERNALALGLAGLVGVLYTGLKWLSALRTSLITVFELPAQAVPGYVRGKLRDLGSLASLGLVLGVSVVISNGVSRFSTELVTWAGLRSDLSWVLTTLTWFIGLATSTILFLLCFWILARPALRTAELISGGVLGAVGFEVLKRVSGVLLAAIEQQLAFQIFGFAFILLIWINYFSKLVIFSAAWAYTCPSARARRDGAVDRLARGRALADARNLAPYDPAPWSPRMAFAVGAGAMLGLVALVRRARR